MIHVDLGALGLPDGVRYGVHDRMHGMTYHWTGSHNFVKLHPGGTFMHLFRIEP